MRLLRSFSRLGQRLFGPSRLRDPHVSTHGLRICRYEDIEPRTLMAADIHVGGVYFEEASGDDSDGDVIQISFEGGQPGTQMTRVVIDGDKDGKGISVGDVFFDTQAGGLGAFGHAGFKLIANDGFNVVSTTVVDGGTKIVIDLAGFDAGEKLIFSIDADEVQFVDSESGIPDVNALVEGAEFQRSQLTATFTAPHFFEATGKALFWDEFNTRFADAAAQAGTTLKLPPDTYGAGNAMIDRTAGAVAIINQIPLPISIAGVVYEDIDLDNQQDSIDPGIGNVQLTLEQWNGVTYVSTGKTTITNAQGAYKFDALAPGRYRITETQPANYFSIGATPGTVGGSVRGVVVSPDVLGEINLLGGEDSVRNDFAEAKPASIAGHVHAESDGDCIQEAGEPALAGVVIHLLDANGNVIRSTTTDANGNYKFEGLRPGVYGVREEQPAGYYDGMEHAGSAGGILSANDVITQIKLNSGTDALEYNFCELLPASIRGHVHADLDGDCMIDPGEPMLAGVKIFLLDANGNVLRETVTDVHGEYKFEGLAPGTYSIREEQPAGYFDSGEMPGTAGGVVSANDLISQIVLGAGVHATDYDFCEMLPASLSGHVHVDMDGDCEYDPGEPSLAGVVIRLRDSSGAVVRTTTTDHHGNYKFENLAPGEYTVEEVQPVGYFDSEESPGSAGGVVSSNDVISQIVLGSGVNAVDYNFCELLPASISGRVHADADGDCELDPGEPMLAGVVIHLLDQAGNVIKSTVTDAEGKYKFESLAPGTYGVREEQPADYFDGMEEPGSAGGIVSANDLITAVVLGSGVNATDYDFCELLPASISGHIHADADGDCIHDPDEPMLAGVKVHLLDQQGNVIATTVTDHHGEYKFENLAPGTYGIREEQPVGYFDSEEKAGTAGGIVSANDLITQIVLGPGVNATDYDFCELLPVSISGYVYHDANNNGVKDAGEEGIGGVQLFLKDASGQPLPGTVTTDSTGFYKFDGLAPGTYGIGEVQPVGWFDGIDAPGNAGGLATNPGDSIVGAVLGPGIHAIHYNFGELKPATIRGHVQTDMNGDCILQEGEIPLANVVIELYDDGNLVATTKTDVHGEFEFTGLRPGSYTIREIQPAAYLDGDEEAGTAGGVISADDEISGIVLTSGQIGEEYHFCELPPGSISGYVFQDGAPIGIFPGETPDIIAVRDGILTPDDRRLAGVVLELRHGVTGLPIMGSQSLGGHYAADQPIRTTTNASGYFEFIGLPPGNYAVFEIQPEGFIDSLDTPGTSSGVAININTNPQVLAQVLFQLAVSPNNDAILRIALFAGENSTSNNFSEVLTETPYFFEEPDPVTPEYIPSAEVAIPLPPTPYIPPVLQQFFPTLLLGGSSPVLNYTWHLSVVDAGQPRGMDGDEAVVRLTNARFDMMSWRGLEISEAEWELAESESDEVEGQHVAAKRLKFGVKNGIPVTGDFNGDGHTDIGVFKDGQWFVDLNGNGVWDDGDLWAKLGSREDRPVTGDWDGDGKTDIGIFGPAWPGDPRAIKNEPGLPDPDNQTRHRHKNVPPTMHQAALGVRALKLTSQGKMRADLIDHVFLYGTAPDTPVVGDWNGDGTDTIAVFRDGQWYRDLDGDGRWGDNDIVAKFGQSGDKPVAGDWNGDGRDDVGVFRGGKWILDSNANHLLDDEDEVIILGKIGDRPVVGDWHAEGRDRPGIYRDVDRESADQVPTPATTETSTQTGDKVSSE